MPTYESLCSKHPDYAGKYWQKIKVLYAGAKTLRDVLHPEHPLCDDIFPRHIGEEDWVYKERLKRSCYFPYMSQLIDYLLAILFSDPVIILSDKNQDGKSDPVAQFYEEFKNNTARPGSRERNFTELLRDVALDALLYQRAWVLVDLPKRPKDANGEPIYASSRLEEEALSLDRAYCVRLDPICVFDWEVDDENDTLNWVLVHNLERRRETVEDKRNMLKESFTVYDSEGWTRYVYEYKEDRPPNPRSKPDYVESGRHSFGEVPVAGLELPEGLWAGGKLENIAVEIFNKRSALSWGQYRSLFQILVAKLQNPDPMNPVSEDIDRAVNQQLGPGRVWVGAEKDSLEFVSPNAAPFAEARNDLKELRDEMHRVLFQMAQSVDNSGGALRRSAESRHVDMSSSRIICLELGRYFKELAVDIYQKVAVGRKEKYKWTSAGFDSFDEVSVNDFVSEAGRMEQVEIPSDTFQTLYKFELAKRLLPGTTPEQQQKILKELEKGVKESAELEKELAEAEIASKEKKFEEPAKRPNESKGNTEQPTKKEREGEDD